MMTIMVLWPLLKKLDYSIRIIPYGGSKLKDLSGEQERIAIGVLCSAEDCDRRIAVTDKKDMIEAG